MKRIRALLIFATLVLLASLPMVNAQNFVSQKEAIKVAINYINGYFTEYGNYDVDDVVLFSTETKSNIELLHEVHIGGYKLILSGIKRNQS